MDDLANTVAKTIPASPARYDDLYDAMRTSEMNAWVGGSDPELVGYFTDNFLARMMTIAPDSRVLDFGSGIGRVAVSLLRRGARPETLVGFDIVPPLVEFCCREVIPRFPGTTFELIAGANDHYDRFIDSTVPARSREELIADYADRFTHAYAISVFTHLDADQFIPELSFVRSLLAMHGEFLFTAFTLTPFSRRMIEQGKCDFASDECEYRDEGRIFIGRRSDPLAFIAYERSLIEQMVDEAGLVIAKVEYGNWMGGGIGDVLQDIYVCRKVP